MAINIKPLGDKLVIKALVEETVTASGIVLPDTVDKEKPETGQVVAAGPGKLLEDGKREVMEVKVGDKVVFTKYAPNEIKVDGEDYLIISQSDVLGILS